MRIIFNLGWRDTIKSLFSELQIPTIFSLYTVSRIYESTVFAKEFITIDIKQEAIPVNTRNL